MRLQAALAGIFCSAFLVFAAVPSGLAQNITGIFITPVPDAPFTGVIKVDRTIVRPDGKVESLKTFRDTGRDSRAELPMFSVRLCRLTLPEHHPPYAFISMTRKPGTIPTFIPIVTST